MRFPDSHQAAAALLACLGVFLPWTQLHGQTGSSSALPAGRPTPMDVSLAENGALFGQVVDAQGRPLAWTAVVLRQANRAVVGVVADLEGRFVVTGLRGGTYEIATPRSMGLYRLWAARTAPPSARSGLLIVENGPQVRGQQAMSQYLAKPWVVTAVVAAAIAVPVVVASQKESSSRTPASK